MLYCQLDSFKGLLTLANKTGIFAWVRKHWQGLINHLREMSSRNNLSTKLCSKTLLCFFQKKQNARRANSEYYELKILIRFILCFERIYAIFQRKRKRLKKASYLRSCGFFWSVVEKVDSLVPLGCENSILTHSFDQQDISVNQISQWKWYLSYSVYHVLSCWMKPRLYVSPFNF